MVWRHLGLATVLVLLLSSAVAKADITISLENANSRGMVDQFELYDVACGRALGVISLGGRTSETVEICGSLGAGGALRIRYQGELEWNQYPELHGWSVLTLPERPRSRRRPSAPGDAG